MRTWNTFLKSYLKQRT